jgi:hypothetical protein
VVAVSAVSHWKERASEAYRLVRSRQAPKLSAVVDMAALES